MARKDGSTLRKPLTVGSLFSGIGGIDLGLERAGMSVRWMVENDPFCRRLLASHWPEVTLYESVRRKHAFEPVDVVAGGFPCQSVSLAGKRLHTEDPRWLWPQMLAVVKQVKPRWVLIENVEGLRTKGLCDVLEGLAECGYDAEWDRLPASWFGAPHQRRRYFVAGYPAGSRCNERPSVLWQPPSKRDVGDTGDVVASSFSVVHGCSRSEKMAATPREGEARTSKRKRLWLDTGAGNAPVANSERGRHASKLTTASEERREETGEVERFDETASNTSLERRQQDPGGSSGDEEANGRWSQDDHFSTGVGEERLAIDWGEYTAAVERWETINGRPSPQPLIRRVDDGLSRGVALGTLQEELRALGNAVVPQVSEWVGRRIIEADAEMAS